MTAPTPEQMRALANSTEALANAFETDREHQREVAAALRAAADQLEAVHSFNAFGANVLVKQIADEWFVECAPSNVSMDDLNLLVHMITVRLAQGGVR
jgi:hypothetical protein